MRIAASQAKIMLGYLVNQGLVILPPTLPPPPTVWVCYTNGMPDKPDNCVALFDGTPKLDGRIMRTGEVVRHPGLIVRIRAVDYDTGFNFGQLLIGYFDEVIGLTPALVTLDSVTYNIRNVSRKTDLVPLGEEKNTRRQIFTLDTKLTITR